MKKKILIVEDNPINADLLKEMLNQIDIESEILYSGKTVFDILDKKDFNLIFLDVMMPEISGYEIMEKIAAHPKYKHIPVLFISALSESKDIVKGLELGSYDYITKPFKIDELKAKVQNILRIKDLQDELKNGKETLEKIYHYAADCILTLDKAYTITSCSKSFADIFDTDCDKLNGKCFCGLIDCTLENHACITKLALAKKDVQDLPIKDKIFQIHVSEIKNIKNKVDEYIVILRDVTALREIEKQKEIFVATLTHDLKTPVRAEIRAMELLLEGHLGELNNSQKDLLTEVLNSSNYMFMMIDSLLAKHKHDNDQVKLDKTFFSINDLINTCLKEVKYVCESKNQTIKVLFENEKEEIHADFIEMKRTITNLLTNAMKYSEEHSIIKIKVFEENSKIKISFIDNGPGIAENEIHTIFDKYVTQSKRFRKVGSGLGLFISKRIASMHGGDITVESEEGKGSNFTLSLPLEQIAEVV